MLYDFMLRLSFFHFKVVYDNGNQNSITELKGFLSIIFFPEIKVTYAKVK